MASALYLSVAVVSLRSIGPSYAFSPSFQKVESTIIFPNRSALQGLVTNLGNHTGQLKRNA